MNCWKPLKLCVPQHRNETGSCVTVAKAERNAQMAHGASLSALTMGNQQPSPEQGKVQRLSLAGVGPSGPKWFAPREAGEDIVCAHVKAWGVRPFGDGAALEQRPNVNKADETAYGGRRGCPDRDHPGSHALRAVRLIAGNFVTCKPKHIFGPSRPLAGGARKEADRWIS